MKAKCKFNDPSRIPAGIPNNFDYGLIINKEYIVMGLAIFKASNVLYLLVDEDGRPGWFPFSIFDLMNNKIPQSWFLRVNTNDIHTDNLNLIGFYELCYDRFFFNKLLDRDKETIQTYFKRKSEAEKEFLLLSDQPEVTKVADILSETWLMCPFCTETWEERPTNKNYVLCPKCNQLSIAPKSIASWKI